ncbi:TIGR02301 family protein [Hansschlegelia beijingensis]|uniref:Uncharacterized protein (TIGR02301 family) n=1 Tax=Hansschlegelia beijingensis TaxID=1133344 RepID=A0A7W6D3M9_9HYPH|nr:uncharacterized protein (TIGR02301 family) [Hansschlegelia beijingensis]
MILSPALRAALAASLCLASLAAVAQPAERRGPKHAPAPPPAEAPPPPELSAPPPYEPQLLRLAEVLGALHHLRTVCAAGDADVWRDRMAALIEADAPTPERRDRLAGAFNASFRTWARSYRSCTPAAEVAVKRFLQEAGKLASEVRQRYGP